MFILAGLFVFLELVTISILSQFYDLPTAILRSYLGWLITFVLLIICMKAKKKSSTLIDFDQIILKAKRISKSSGVPISLVSKELMALDLVGQAFFPPLKKLTKWVKKEQCVAIKNEAETDFDILKTYAPKCMVFFPPVEDKSYGSIGFLMKDKEDALIVTLTGI